MNLWSSLEGMLEIEMTSAEPELALEGLNAAQIALTQIRRKGPLTVTFQIRRKDWNKLLGICEKRGESVKILERKGIYWTCIGLLKRPTLLFGIVILFCLALFLPTRVYFICVEGNKLVPEKRILEAASETGIKFGASRKQVRSEKMKNGLLEVIPELQWAGVNTSGCVATISVRERSDEKNMEPANWVSSIVAARDGYILSGTVTRGNGLFHTGQTVREGQLLISGYTDCGFCIQATQAEGEIFAQTNRFLRAFTPSKMMRRTEIAKCRKDVSILIGKKRINLWKDSGNYTAGCDRIYKEYYLALPGGFQLPAALCVETINEYHIERQLQRRSDAERTLTAFADRYVSHQMAAGKIQERMETLFQEDGVYSLDGEYQCVEMIGRVQIEQIGE